MMHKLRPIERKLVNQSRSIVCMKDKVALNVVVHRSLVGNVVNQRGSCNLEAY